MLQNKNILYIWQSSYPWEIRVDKTIQALLSVGAHVNLLCRNKKSESNTAGLQYFDLSDEPFNQALPFSPIWTRKISKILIQQKIDLVIARDILVTPSALMSAKKLGVPVIMDMAEHYPAAMRGWKKYNENFWPRFLVKNLKIPDHVEMYCVRRVQGIITVCREQEVRLQSMGMPSHQMCSVYNTPDLMFFPTSLVSPPSQVRRFAHHGFLTPERGLNQAIEAFSILKKRGFAVELLLAGSGESELELRALAEKLQAPVQFTGPYQFADFPRLISEIDAGLLPYQINEFLDHTVANKLFDYMAVGKPVLVSKTKALQRIISETKAGFAIDIGTPESFADSILDFLKVNPQTLGEQGRRAIEEKYNWEHDKKTLIQFIGRFL